MVCIGIAFVFWLLNKLSSQFPSTPTIYLSYQVPPQRALSEVPPLELKASLKRKGWDLLWQSSPHISLEINDIESNKITFTNGELKQYVANAFGLRPDEVGLLGIEQITLHLEARTQKWIPIQVLTDIRFAQNFQLAAPVELNPAAVLVSGPQSLIQRLQHIKTDTLRFENVTDKMKGRIKISPHSLLHFAQTEVEVSVVGEQFTEKTMYITVSVNNAPARLKIFPNKVRLSCIVGLSHYNLVSPSDFEVAVDLKNTSLLTTDNTLPLSIVKIPDAIKNVKCSPNAVEFYFEK